MLLTPAALWLVEKRAPPRAPRNPSVKEPRLDSRISMAAKKRSGALHAVHDHADNRRNDRPGHAAANQLANKGPDIHAAGGPLQHRDERGQERPAGRAAESAGDCVARGSEVHILCRRADRVAADRASNELDDKVDNRARHGVSSTVAANSRGHRGNFALRTMLLPHFCSVSVTSQSSCRSFRNTIARFRNRDLVSGELPPEHAQDDQNTRNITCAS